MKRIVIAGGTGLVGQSLVKELVDKGYKPVVLSRKDLVSSGSVEYARWDPVRGLIDKEALRGARVIINLSGANLGERRWTKSRKKELSDSRILSTRLLYEIVKDLKICPEKFITASATGIYGTRTSDTVFNEEDSAASDFLGSLCEDWEKEADSFALIGAKVVKLRSGIVLDKKSDALKKMILPVKLGAGSAIGSGRQYIPWIHSEDLVGMYLQAIEDKEFEGVFNAVAPEQFTNRDFMKTLAAVLKKPFRRLNVPAFMLKLIYGEMSDIILKGSRVSSDKIGNSGYQFVYPELNKALKKVLNGSK